MQEVDFGSFKGLHQLRGVLVGIAAQAATEDAEGMPLRHLLQSTSLGEVRPTVMCLSAPVYY